MLRTILISALLAGCYSEAGVAYDASYATPQLEYVSPGVQVVADYDYPVFYASGVYWRYDGGYWYRAPSLHAGWRVSANVPVAVRRIDRPGIYAHYHSGARGWGGGRTVVRATPHRTVVRQGPSRTVVREAPSRTVIRDHRNARPARVRDHRR